MWTFNFFFFCRSFFNLYFYISCFFKIRGNDWKSTGNSFTEYRMWETSIIIIKHLQHKYNVLEPSLEMNIFLLHKMIEPCKVFILLGYVEKVLYGAFNS